MGLNQFLKNGFAASLDVFDPEEVRIGNAPVFLATADETTSSNALGVGAMKGERNLRIQFPTDFYRGELKSGMSVSARGQDWQISADDDSISRGAVATTIQLVEPERREEF